MDKVIGLGLSLTVSIGITLHHVLCHKYEAKSGFIGQWFVSAGIFCFASIMHVVLKFPVFQPFAMVGGALGAIGCILTPFKCSQKIPDKKTGINIAISQLVFSLIGYGISRFGLFKIVAIVPSVTWLFGIGFLLLIIGGFLCVVLPHFTNDSDSSISDLFSVKNFDKNTLKSVVSGVCFALMFFPIIFEQDNVHKFKHALHDGVYYIFPLSCGIFLTSTLFMLYDVFLAKKSLMEYKELIIPASLVGILISIGHVAWLFANDIFSPTITYPVNAYLPTVLTVLFSLFYFKEIKGKKNFTVMLIGASVIFIGAILVIASHSKKIARF